MHNHVGEHAMKNQQTKRRISNTGEDSTTQEETQRHRRRLGNTATASREIGPIESIKYSISPGHSPRRNPRQKPLCAAKPQI